MTDVVAGNARYWEQLAPHRHGCTVAEIRAGRALEAFEPAVLGDLAGRRVLHVASSVSDEGLQMALAGAVVTAVDIASAHVATGQTKARELGVDVDYRVGDMTRLPADLTGFDVVYVSWGGLCWVPDLGAWMRDMARRLVPGGRVVVAEHHPLWEVLAVSGADGLRVVASYVDPADRGDGDLSKAPQVVLELGEEPAGATTFVWSLGAVVSAMLGAGLTLTTLEEHALPAMYPGLDAAGRLPAVYVAVGTTLRP